MRLTVCRGPTPTPPNHRHDGHEREVQAGWGRCGRTVRGDCPRSRGRRMGVIPHQVLRSWFYPPSKRYQEHASALSWHRLVAPSCCPSARGRRSGPVPAWDRLHGRHMCVVPVARRPSRLVTLPWVVAHPQAPVQLVQLPCAFQERNCPFSLAAPRLQSAVSNHLQSGVVCCPCSLPKWTRRTRRWSLGMPAVFLTSCGLA